MILWFYNIVLSVKKWGGGNRSGQELCLQGGHCSEICWASICLWDVVSDCPCETPVIFSPLFPSLIKPYLDPRFLSLFYFSSSRPCPAVGWWWGHEWMAVWVLAAGWGQPPQGCMFCLMHWVRRYLGIHRMHYSLKKLQEESGSRRTLQHTLDVPFISVSLCLRFDLEMCGSRAIWSTMSSDLSLYFSCSFLSSPELRTQLLKAGRTLMFSLKLRLAFFAGVTKPTVTTELFLLFSVQRERKILSLPNGFAFLHVLFIWDTLRNTSPTDSCPLNVP